MNTEPKIIRNRNYSYDTMLYCSRFLNKQVNKYALGYEESQHYCLGVIDTWFSEKRINRSEKKWLTKIYVDDELDSGGDTRYLVDKRGRILDYDGLDLDVYVTTEYGEYSSSAGYGGWGPDE